MSEDDSFLARWSRRKARVRSGAPVAEPPPPAAMPAAPSRATVPTPAPVVDAASAPAPVAPAALARDASAPAPSAPPLPTLDDVAALTRESDYSPFVRPGVDASVRNAALKKLFTDPHFNVMDGLDTYIDDYGVPDPIPPSMLRQMHQSAALGLFDERPAVEDNVAAGGAAPPADVSPVAESSPDAEPAIVQAGPDLPTEPAPAPDEDPDLRLQQHDGAGPDGAAARPRA